MNALLPASLLPLLITSGAAVILVIIISFYRGRELISGVTLAALIAAFVSLFYVEPSTSRLFLIDRYALFYLGLLFPAAAAASVLLRSGIEIFPLLLLSTTGAGIIVISGHFVSFFLGLETLSVSLYVLIAYFREKKSQEAAVKYLVLASVSSALLLLGVSFLYYQTGTLEIAPLTSLSVTPYVLAGIGLIVTGVGFKLALVPFHMWAPDIYEGSSAPIAGFIATVSKGAVFAFALRYAALATHNHFVNIGVVISVLAVASMFVGNLLALLQKNIRRLLGYSSIAHAGYILVAFQAAGPMGLEAVGYYLTVYFISILGAFGVIAVLSENNPRQQTISDYEGLAWRHPFLAVVLTVMFFSLAGIPFTAGFIGKFYVLAAGISSNQWFLVVSLIISSVIGLFYYLRVIIALFHDGGRETAYLPVPVSGTAVLSVLAVLAVVLGVYPAPFIEVLSAAFK